MEKVNFWNFKRWPWIYFNGSHEYILFIWIVSYNSPNTTATVTVVCFNRVKMLKWFLYLSEVLKKIKGIKPEEGCTSVFNNINKTYKIGMLYYYYVKARIIHILIFKAILNPVRALTIKNSQYSNVLYFFVNYLVKPFRNWRKKYWKARKGLLTFSGLLFKNISITWPPLYVLLHKINCIVYFWFKGFLFERFRSLSHMPSLGGI